MSTGKNDSTPEALLSEKSEKSIQQKKDLPGENLSESSEAISASVEQELVVESSSELLSEQTKEDSNINESAEGEKPVASVEGEKPVASVEGENLKEAKEQDEVSNIEKTVCLVNDFPLDRRFASLALKTEVVLGLQEKGYRSATRYQQAILHHLLLGKDWWVNARLSSNRGVAFGAYFTEIASCALEDTSVLICSAIPEVRRNLSNDIMECAIFTDVQVGMIQKEIKEGQAVNFSVKPNIFITSPTNLLTLINRGLIDVSQTKAFYLDEAERIKSDEEVEAITNVLKAMPKKPQMIIQTSALSMPSVQTIQGWVDGIKPMLLEKIESTERTQHQVSEDFSLSKLQSILIRNNLDRTVVVCREESDVEDLGLAMAGIGWDIDILRKDSHPKQKERNEKKLKIGILQILVCTIDVLLQLNIPFLSQVILKEPCSKEEHQKLCKSLPNTELIVFGSPEDWGGDLKSIEAMSEDEYVQEQNRITLETLRKNSTRLGFKSYEKLVDSLLEQPDGKPLLALAIRQALQWDRISTLDSREEQLRLENKDIFQRRRTQRRGKFNRRKFNKRR